MADWIKQLKPKTAKLKNPANLSDTAIKLLQDDFALAEEKYPGLPEILLHYVVDGEGEEVLPLLDQLKDLRLALCVTSACDWNDPHKTSAARRNLFRKRHIRDGKVLYRLAQMFHSVHSPSPRECVIWNSVPDGIEWFDTLLYESANRSIGDVKWSAEDLVGILTAGDCLEDILARLVLNLSADPNSYQFAYVHCWVFDAIEGIADYLEAHHAVIAEALQVKNAAKRAAVIEFLNDGKVPLEGDLLVSIAELAVGPAKSVRTMAVKYLQAATNTEKAFATLTPALDSRTASVRGHAVEALLALDRPAAVPILRELIEREKSEKVRSQIERVLDIETDSAADAPEDQWEIPAAREFDEQVELDAEFEEKFAAMIARVNEKALERDRHFHREAKIKSEPKPAISDSKRNKIIAGMKSPEACRKERQAQDRWFEHSDIFYRELDRFLNDTPLPFVARLRLAYQVGLITTELSQGWNTDMDSSASDLIGEEMRKNDWNLLDLDNALTAAGIDSRLIALKYMEVGWQGQWNPFGLSNDSIWPYFAKNPWLLEYALGVKPDPGIIHDFLASETRGRAIQILSIFPHLPAAFTSVIWDHALGTGKKHRESAQACLRKYPDLTAKVVAGLTDKRKAVRGAAAAWLGKIGDAETIKPLRKALAKEKDDVQKSLMMEALEKLGDDIDQFLNRKQLLEEAKKGLAKKLPEPIEWFPFDKIPTVHWEKNKQKVAPEILKWFLVQCCKLKNVEIDPLLRRYLLLMRSKELAGFGGLLLDAWLTHDTAPRHSHEEATKLADQDVQQMKQWVSQNPKWYPDFEENVYRKQQLNIFLTQCLGSASSSRGILGIAAVGCGVEVIPKVERYIRYWYGKRMTQCKALLQLLAGIDHPQAIQVVLSIATRFRTKAIQKEAARLADAIAARNDWTRDEMADRTIPDGGFGGDGTQVIDYGTRTFTARLQDDFSIELTNDATGKIVKSLPDANKAEDAAEVKELKKDFSAARKEIKAVIKLQRERLHEAMCIGRHWDFEAWKTYLNQHPVVGRFCQQLVWFARRGEEIVASFRPLPDRTLTDCDDEEVKLKPDDVIQLAHASFLPAEQGESWLQHLADYEITPLFAQFGRQTPGLNEEALAETALDDLKGHLVNSFKLRSRMNKLGYTRGQAEDAGWFMTYLKNFPSLKIQAVINFTGNIVPEEDRTVALTGLHFVRMTEEDSYMWRPLRLDKVPQVLISECWNDFRTAANEGSGFDPDWEKKSEW